MVLLERLKAAIGRQLQSVEIESEGSVYRASVNGADWYIPYPDEGQAVWCLNLLDNTERYLPYLNEGDTVLEAGAATGEYTVAAAERVGQSGRIHTFEAEPGNYTCLEKNLALNNVTDRVSPNQMALTESPGETLSIAVADKIGEHQVGEATDEMSEEEYRDVVGEAADNKVEEVTVTSTTVDAYCEEEGIENIDMLKLTVNGHEAAILKGADRMLESTKYVFINVDYSEAVSLLENKGFVVVEEQERDDTGRRLLWKNSKS